MEINRLRHNGQQEGKVSHKHISSNLNAQDRVDIGSPLPENVTGYNRLMIDRKSPSDPDPNITEATDVNFRDILKTSQFPVMVDFYNPG